MARLHHAVRAVTGTRVLCAWLVAVVTLAAVAGWTWHQQQRSQHVEDARGEALTAARTSVPKLLSYHAASVDQDLAAAQKLLTGSFRDEFGDLAQQLIAPAAHRRHITTSASVRTAGVVDGTADEVKALLFVSQSTTSDRSATTKVDGSRLEVTMRRVDGRWLIAAMDPV
jgi:Mce-associated membrane protein